MADRNLSRFCVHYYNHRRCPFRGLCPFNHKSKDEVERLSYVAGEDFFYGKLKVSQRPCRFFLRGNCIHQDNCRFRHDPADLINARPAFETVVQPNRLNTVNGNQPSTSQSADVINRNAYNLGLMLGGAEAKSCTERTDSRTESPTSENEPETEAEGTSTSNLSSNSLNKSWVDAPEFVPKNQTPPKPRSYAEALSPEGNNPVMEGNRRLCPHINKDGVCRNVAHCDYLHGDVCDMCERPVLHPFNEEERKKHRTECIQQHEKNMELSFAVARSKGKSCGVCFEVIMEKANGEQRFGILPNCNHVFCLACIRKWRQARQFENKIIRACPECRVTSDFVCPSSYWVDSKEDKDKLIDDYKNALSRKDCKYFKKGAGKCPFGNKCFYLHAFPDGQKCDVGPPQRQRRPRNAEIDVLQVMLWDFLDDREFPWQSLAELEDLVSIFTDSDESDWSDYELFMD